jgi:hypothetical protein
MPRNSRRHRNAEVDFKGEKRSNTTHASTTDPDARLARKGSMSAELRHMGHALVEDRNAPGGQRAGEHGRRARRARGSQDDAGRRGAERPRGHDADRGRRKGQDAAEFASTCEALGVVPNVARNVERRGGSAVPEAIAATESHAISQQKRKRIEVVFGWSKRIGQLRQVILCGFERVDRLHMLTMTAFNLTRMRTLDRFAAQVRPAQG